MTSMMIYYETDCSSESNKVSLPLVIANGGQHSVAISLGSGYLNVNTRSGVMLSFRAVFWREIPEKLMINATF